VGKKYERGGEKDDIVSRGSSKKKTGWNVGDWNRKSKGVGGMFLGKIREGGS